MLNNRLTQSGAVIMNNLSNHKIAQANELVEAVAKMDTLPMKLFEIAVGAVDSTASSEQYRTAHIDKRLVLSFLPRQQATQMATEQGLAKAMQRLRERSGFELTVSGKDGGMDIIGIQPITQTETDEHKDYVSITFSPEIMPYITELKKNFTQYSLEDIGNLSSRDAIALYKILMEKHNQAKRATNSQQAATLHNPTIEVAFLRRITESNNKYHNFADFNRYVISKAVKDINKHTNFTITYDKLKSGRYVTRVQFHISDRNANLTAKRDAKPATKQAHQTNQANQTAPSLTEFLTNQYTALLMANQLINTAEITTNEQSRLDYLTKLYPLYAEFIAKYDKRKLSQHLEYVAEHKQGDASLDYLVAALKDYQSKLDHPTSKQPTAATRRKQTRINEALPTWAQSDTRDAVEPASAESIRLAKEALAQLREQEAKPTNG